MPTSFTASTAAGLTSLVGSEPPDQTSTRSPASCFTQPAAICERPALCVQRKSTLGTVVSIRPSTRARALSRSFAKRSAMIGT